MPVATCPPHESLAAYILGDLPYQHMNDIRDHLDGCPACRSTQASLRPTYDCVAPAYAVAWAQEEITTALRRRLDHHLSFCEPCRHEYDHIRHHVHEITRTLSQYQMPSGFRRSACEGWKQNPSLPSARPNASELARQIFRARQGNLFAFEKLITDFRHFARTRAFLLCGDFQLATRLAQHAFRQPLPRPDNHWTAADMHTWIDKQLRTLIHDGTTPPPDPEEVGLSGYSFSEKLRRHRILISHPLTMKQEAAQAFLLSYVERVAYPDIARILMISDAEVTQHLRRTTMSVIDTLTADHAAFQGKEFIETGT